MLSNIKNTGKSTIWLPTHIHKQSGAVLERRQGLDATLKKIIKRQLPFLIGGTITGVVMTYY
ncbi:MAG TPA: hypothetical protein VGW09_08790 [Nitrososphaeraceae archaeon]|nr:hypothetical protein [Nitrososphaeraceae archaeon]